MDSRLRGNDKVNVERRDSEQSRIYLQTRTAPVAGRLETSNLTLPTRFGICRFLS